MGALPMRQRLSIELSSVDGVFGPSTQRNLVERWKGEMFTERGVFVLIVETIVAVFLSSYCTC